MTFRPEPDTSVADWWLSARGADRSGGEPWTTVLHGPAGYAAYVRLRHHDVDVEPSTWVLRLVVGTLRAHTSAEVVVAHWDGHLGGCGARGRRLPDGTRVWTPEPHAFPDEVMATPHAELHDVHGVVRRYLLLRGALDRLGDWPAHPGEEPASFPELVCGAMWPDDRSWCYVWDVDDDHGATIACDEELAAALLADGRFAAWRVGRGDPDPPERLRPLG